MPGGFGETALPIAVLVSEKPPYPLPQIYKVMGEDKPLGRGQIS
jgi:hypothetical protein